MAVDVHTLDGKQSDLTAEPSGVAAQPAVASDHAMARHDDRKGVGPYRLTDGTRGAGVSHLIGDVSVRYDSSIRNFGEPLVDALLKLGGSGEVERKMEAFSLTFEILIELVEGDP